MPIRKKGNIKIQTSPKGTQVKQTGYTFYSYDKDSAALYFQFKNDDESPVNLKHASVRLLFVLGDKQFIAGGDDVEIVDVIKGTAKYTLPDVFLKGYTGKITGYVYLDFEDGSRTDDGRFNFTIKRSAIDGISAELGDSYVKDFHELKQEVQEAADKVKAEISEKVDTNVSDVKEAKSTGISNINDYVSEVETSKTTASKNISDKVAEVESNKTEAIEDIHNVITTVENEISDVKDLWNQQKTDMVVGGRNLLNGTSNEWEIAEFSGYVYGQMTYVLDKKSPLKIGDSVTYSLEIDNSFSESGANAQGFVSFVDSGGANIKELKTAEIKPGEVKEVSATTTVPEGTVRILAFKIRKLDGKNNQKIGVRKNNLQRGISTDWQPAPEDYYAEMDKIKQAIINLGGSV